MQIGEHALQVLSVEAGAEELVPESFAIEAQAESLSGPVAVKLVEFAYRLGAVFWCFGLMGFEADDDRVGSWMG